ncbi:MULTISPECIES: response regulator transcription factor [Enterobacter]|uniref:response regulator transcription factor n=1 Tax=Enterobacter TaxID=547 RepID=UPI00101B0E72|nr:MULTISPECIES: response regulator transcription factor [Enterobacter]MEA5206354.1 response regulator transcription factor [Enterobacter mori]QBC03365.1 response regulator transcription factor [Enterobacter cloacae]
MKSALIVDDHPLMRMAIRVILESQDIEVVGEASDGPTAINMARKLNPELIILDLIIPGMDGLEVISRLRNQGMPQKILVISSLAQEHFASRCAMAGAHGFIAKNDVLDRLSGALKALRAGRVDLPADCYGPGICSPLQRQNTPHQQRIHSLSDREMVVLQYLSRGWSNKEIADELLLSNKTISTYKTRLLTKLNAHNLVDLLDIAKRQALVE